jgi:hypothetical protein
MLEILKQAGFQVCRENASLYLKYQLSKEVVGDNEVFAIVLFNQDQQQAPLMTVFERVINHNVTDRNGLQVDYTQDDSMRVGSIRVNDVKDIFDTLNKLGYKISEPAIPAAQNGINVEESPIKPTAEQVEARERLEKDVEELQRPDGSNEPSLSNEDQSTDAPF